MDFPPELPEHYRRAIEAASEQAEIVLHQAWSNPIDPQWRRGIPLRQFLYDVYVKPVFFECLRQTHEAARMEHWPAGQLARCVDALWQSLTAHVYGLPAYGGRLSQTAPPQRRTLETFQSSLWTMVLESSEWTHHLEARHQLTARAREPDACTATQHPTPEGGAALEPQAFFAALRQEVLTLQDAGPRLVDAWWSEPATRLGEPMWADQDGRIARLDELMTQAAIGARIAITPGETAPLVWLPLLVAFGKAMHAHKLGDLKLSGVRSAEDGQVLDQSARPGTVIFDLFGLAADYLENLETRAPDYHVARQKDKHGSVAGGESTPAERLAEGAYVFKPVAGGWKITFAGRRATLPGLEGMNLIHRLLGNPGRSVSAAALLDREELSDGPPVVDDRALKESTRRLNQIRNEHDLAKESGNTERIAELEEEALQIGEYRQKARGLGGRSRRLGSDAERARKTARRRYDNALRALGAVLPDCARHLKDSIHSGSSFEYRPSSDISWLT